MTRHLIGLSGIDLATLQRILGLAELLRNNRHHGVDKLKGKLIAALFFEPSTRTRLSFELAARRLGADFISFPLESSSRVKGESLLDTISTVQAMGVDALIIRHSASGILHWLKDKMSIPLINAGDGAHEHPTQALLDLDTIKQFFPSVKSLQVAMIGDIKHSRVVRSSIHALKILGAHITLVGPPTLLPSEFCRLGVNVSWQLEEAVRKADVVYLLRIQHERQQKGLLPSLKSYTSQYGLTEQRLQWLKPGALVMHPGPVNVGVEITAAALRRLKKMPPEQARVSIEHQVASGVPVRAAVLDFLLGGDQR